MKFFIFICFITISFSAFLQLEEGKRITKELCSEKYFGRGYVNFGDSLAAEFLSQEFNKLGLKKLKKSWFQSFYFDVNTFPKKMELSINGNKLIPGKDFLMDPSSASSDMIWKYRYITKNELFSEKLVAELVNELRNSKSWNSLIIDTRNYSGDSLKKIKSLQVSLTEVCHVISITDEKFTFSVSNQQFAHSLIYVKGNLFEKDALIKTEIDAVIKKNHQARNVLAYLPSKNIFCKKTILVTAHYDHLGGMGDETFFPGANDNASGTSMLITLAKEFQSKPSKYNFLFIAFAGEEAGLLGSKYFVENPLLKLKRIKFVQNLDIMGSGEEGITVVNASVYPKIFEKINTINEQQKLLIQIKQRGKAANSDHYWFTEKGVPAFFIYTMGPNKNYHDIFDTYDALSFNEYNDLVKLISEFLRKI